VSDRSADDLLAVLAAAVGISSQDLQTAISAAADARQERKAAKEQPKSVYQDRELVYDDESAFIFRRGTTKSRTYYVRIYDAQSRRPFVKSLRETDRVAALAKARVIYQEIKGKVSRGERLKTITNKELVALYLEKIGRRVTTVPQQGVTPDTLRLKKYFLGIWLQFIESLGFEKTPIDQIQPSRTRDFGHWFANLPKESGRAGPRSIEQINNCIAEVSRMFREVAVRDRYISREHVPEIDRLKEQPDERHKRDILTTEQYERLNRFMWNNWARNKEIKPLEKQKRLSFFYTMGLLYNTGLRPKELLGLRINEISAVETEDPEIRKTHLKIFIRATNSKTGRSRVVVAPIKNRIHRIKEAYKAMDVEHTAQDFLLFNPGSSKRTAYTRQALYQRLQEVLEKSGLKEELEGEGKNVSLYSARHAFITWRLQYGNAPIHLVAKVAGTSIQKIEQTYGHIEVEKQTELLTRNQGYARKGGVDLQEKIDALEP
jgi:integrase